MTDEELIKVLRSGNNSFDDVHAAADRIEELVREAAETHTTTMLRIKKFGAALKGKREAEAKLAKAVDTLRFYADVNNYDEGIIGTTHEAPVWSESDFTEFEWDNGDKARAVLAELEKTE